MSDPDFVAGMEMCLGAMVAYGVVKLVAQVCELVFELVRNKSRKDKDQGHVSCSCYTCRYNKVRNYGGHDDA